MRAVLYATDFEPITVIELGTDLAALLVREGAAIVPVPEPPAWLFTGEAIEPLRLRTVRIKGERLRRGNLETLMLFTTDEESALLLRATFLPGQRSELNERQRSAYAAGMIAAFMK